MTNLEIELFVSEAIRSGGIPSTVVRRAKELSNGQIISLIGPVCRGLGLSQVQVIVGDFLRDDLPDASFDEMITSRLPITEGRNHKEK